MPKKYLSGSAKRKLAVEKGLQQVASGPKQCRLTSFVVHLSEENKPEDSSASNQEVDECGQKLASNVESLDEEHGQYASNSAVNTDVEDNLEHKCDDGEPEVCIVQKKDSNQMYAMKYMNKSQCVEKDAVRNVMREIEILALLEHPFLVNLWFSFQDAEDMFMVVDLLLGGDLRYHIQQSGRFDEERVRFYVCELALALQYLQEQHILHRDIKPDNILLDEEGHVHITDFNIATVLQDGQLATSMTGTKPYMAPEVFDCALDECPGYSYAVDWWSLGVCAYEMLRSKRPFDIHSGTSISEVRQMFALYTVHFSSTLASGMRDLLRKLLCVKPGKRINTLSELTKHPYVADMDFDQLLEKKITPPFVPSKDHLNCDPTFELEEMIIEAKPLHKKKKRLSKQNSKREQQGSSHRLDIDPIQVRVEEIQDEFRIYNRQTELALRERERKEREWQEELEEHMKTADPHANYRKDLKLPLVNALRLSPALSRSLFGRRTSASRSPSKSPDRSEGLTVVSDLRRDSSSPLKWIDSPRRDRPTLKPFQSIDIGGDSDSASDSEDKAKDTFSGRTVYSEGKADSRLPLLPETVDKPNDKQEPSCGIILCTDAKGAESPSNNNNALHQCNNTPRSRPRSPKLWAQSSNRNSSSQSHDSCDSDAPPYFPRNEFSKQDSFSVGIDGVAIKRQDSGTTDSMVSCCTSFSYQGNPPKDLPSNSKCDENVIDVHAIH